MIPLSNGLWKFSLNHFLFSIPFLPLPCNGSINNSKSAAESGIKNFLLFLSLPLTFPSAVENFFLDSMPKVDCIILLISLFNSVLLYTSCTLDLISNWFKTFLTALTLGRASSTKYMSLYPSENFSNIHIALASPVLLPKPVIFFKGISMPSDFKYSCIAGALSCALAVSIKTLSGPNFLIWFFIFCISGPGLPFVTLLKSEKSISQPSFFSFSPTKGHSLDAIFLVLPPFLAITKLSLTPTVSSKSKVDIPVATFFLFLPFLTASSSIFIFSTTSLLLISFE